MKSEILKPSFEVDGRIHDAMQQNDVPVVRRVVLENLSGEMLRDLTLRITCEPDFSAAWSTKISTLAPDSVYRVEVVDLDFSSQRFAELTERVRGRVVCEVLGPAEDDGAEDDGDENEGKKEVLARHSASVEFLARDEWGGLSSLPEILAAFVVPNHPAVEKILRSAGEILSEWNGDPALSGYQTQDPARVHTTTAAIYAALRKLDVTYVTPPASFEQEGQRIRLPDRLLEARLATCLDIALLAAGCLEQAGLNALVVIIQGHAFVGVWLHDECFPEPAVDDGARLRKRVDLNEITVFDPTGVTARPSPSFEQSVQSARRALDVDAEEIDPFVAAIDLCRARKGRILPLAQKQPRKGDASEAEAAAEYAAAAPDVSQLSLRSAAQGEVPEPTEAPATRVDRWRRKLLDLSLRNRLLNFRETKKTLPILCPDLGRLEDFLAAGKKFRLRSRPQDFSEQDPRDAAIHRRRTGTEALEGLLQEELEAHRLYADVTEEELERRQIEIYRAARLGLEEGGASALYLAGGFLVWYETARSEKARFAPILLLPLELRRKSVREGLTLQSGDEEPRINVTLLEMLRQDFGLDIPNLDPLPEDEKGVDVAQILRTVRTAVREIDRWDVRETVAIGLFSFHKFLMWRDLSERSGELLKSPVVRHLVERPGEPYDPQGVFLSPDRLDEERSPQETYCPLPADSSQLAAVFAAADGRSFVLEGPPGTGKSQTITNLIAHCLAEGKTVLFVSEKMAALNVVHNRLVQVGLERYCLELHSNKTHKREVIAQLERALERVLTQEQEGWESEARRLEELRSELNAWVWAMHRKRAFGLSVFQATSRLIGLRDFPRVELSWSSTEEVDAERLAELNDLVERLATAAGACGEVREHPFAAVRRGEWSSGWSEEVHRTVAALAEVIDPLESAAEACLGNVGLGAVPPSLDTLQILRELAAVLREEGSAPPTSWLQGSDWDETRADVELWIEHGRRRDALRGKLRERFRDEITRLDLDALQARLGQAEEAWFGAAWWLRWTIRRALAPVANDGRMPSAEETPEFLASALALREEERALADADGTARNVLERHWKDGEADWDEISGMVERASKLHALARRATQSGLDDADDLSASLRRLTELREDWARLLGEGRELLREGGALGTRLAAYAQAHESFEFARRSTAELLELDEEKAWPSGAPEGLHGVRETVAAWQATASRLRPWCAWRRVRAEAVTHALGPLLEGFEAGRYDSALLSSVFQRSVTEWWFARVTDSEPILKDFFSPEHERKIERFRSVDERYMELTRRRIQIRLAAQVPTVSSGTDLLPNSEMGILKREIGKKRRHMPVRRLLQKIPNLLPRLKPCLLMSPMSVAQYLDGDAPPFDLVVFDEASQIPVWDAIGALGRGRQAIVVGDPKQLPPTSFFQRADESDEFVEDDIVEDLESILDDCLGAGIPWLPLNWHYRSRHESLIAFSNYHYYRNRLLTFPSPTRSGMGVRRRAVEDGVYDKGKTRTNRAEAREVVAEILRRLRGPSDDSIGVVTFSQAQQTLVEDLLDAERRKDPELDRLLAEQIEEPIFVKNLENVQGDERDVILFSICYGPDAQGRVSMNFGPMNRDGGERRLNVAITRARREVLVFSTLNSEQIDLSRTRARGVADLKNFLEYAEKGPAVLGAANLIDDEAEFDSPFEEAVYDALVEQGRTVHRQVGCARYRIDLAVVDDDHPGRYLLGVECDGANYHRAKTARDRDKLREGVLRDLGWTLHRVWSTDWWSDPEREIAKIREALEQATERAQKGSPAVPAPPTPEATRSAELPELQEEDIAESSQEVKRTIDEIPQQEVCEAVLQILEQNLGAPREELARGTARRLGFSRLGSKISVRVDEAIDLVIRQGFARQEGEIVTWVGK